MDRKPGTTRTLYPVAGLALAAVIWASAALGQEAVPDTVPAITGGPTGFPLPAVADTVRTNLWLTEALMGEIVSLAAASLPSDSTRVMLINEGGDDPDELFGGVATRILRERGHQIYLATADSTQATPVNHVFAYKVIGVELAYPEVGRTLGIWARWVERDVSVTVSVEVSEADSGLLLFNDVVERRFSDRVDNSDFKDVESELYDFTTAEKAGSGWQNRIEEIIVLATLVGLIAVYFANTGN